ncbi:MAG: hypothetical protein ACK5Z0_00870 [Planctomycetota bacterium]
MDLWLGRAGLQLIELLQSSQGKQTVSAKGRLSILLMSSAIALGIITAFLLEWGKPTGHVLDISETENPRLIEEIERLIQTESKFVLVLDELYNANVNEFRTSRPKSSDLSRRELQDVTIMIAFDWEFYDQGGERLFKEWGINPTGSNGCILIAFYKGKVILCDYVWHPGTGYDKDKFLDQLASLYSGYSVRNPTK